MDYADASLWFSAKGRVNRRPYYFAGMAAAGLIKARELVLARHDLVLNLIYLPILLVAVYVVFVLSIKRSHDRGRSGWFTLLMFVPILNLWPIIELTFLKGVDGPNQYGDDPLQGREIRTESSPA